MTLKCFALDNQTVNLDELLTYVNSKFRSLSQQENKDINKTFIQINCLGEILGSIASRSIFVLFTGISIIFRS